MRTMQTKLLLVVVQREAFFCAEVHSAFRMVAGNESGRSLEETETGEQRRVLSSLVAAQGHLAAQPVGLVVPGTMSRESTSSFYERSQPAKTPSQASMDVFVSES